MSSSSDYRVEGNRKRRAKPLIRLRGRWRLDRHRRTRKHLTLTILEQAAVSAAEEMLRDGLPDVALGLAPDSAQELPLDYERLLLVRAIHKIGRRLRRGEARKVRDIFLIVVWTRLPSMLKVGLN